MTQQADYFLPLAGPMPRGYGAPTTVDFPHFESGFCGAIRERVLGPPIHRDAIAAPLSAEARAFEEAAADASGNPAWAANVLDRAHDYAATLTPPDPLDEAREALADICEATSNMELPSLADINRLSAALDRMKKDHAA